MSQPRTSHGMRNARPAAAFHRTGYSGGFTQGNNNQPNNMFSLSKSASLHQSQLSVNTTRSGGGTLDAY